MISNNWPELLIQKTRPAQAVAFYVGCARDPGILGRTLEERSKDRLPVCTKDRAIQVENRGKVLLLHGTDSSVYSRDLRDISASGESSERMLIDKSVLPVELPARRRGVEANAVLGAQQGQALVKQLRSNACAPVLRIHQHHGQPSESVLVANCCERTHRFAVLFRDATPSRAELQEEGPVAFNLIPSAAAAQPQSNRNVGGYHAANNQWLVYT